MGSILDSSVLIAAERRNHEARQALTEIGRRVKDEGLAISVVTLMEMAHGVAKAMTPERMSRRRHFLDDLRAAVPVYAVSDTIALRAACLMEKVKPEG
jgi:predicted nucleic acid-binding protein